MRLWNRSYSSWLRPRSPTVQRTMYGSSAPAVTKRSTAEMPSRHSGTLSSSKSRRDAVSLMKHSKPSSEQFVRERCSGSSMTPSAKVPSLKLWSRLKADSFSFVSPCSSTPSSTTSRSASFTGLPSISSWLIT